MRRNVVLLGMVLAVSMAAWAFAQERDKDATPPVDVEKLHKGVDGFKRSETDGLAQHIVKGEAISQAVATLTHDAMNPLLGVTARSVWVYWSTPKKERSTLPWYYHTKVWVPLVVIMLLLLFNSTLCEAAPPLKVPLNALADLTHKFGALVTMPFFVGLFARAVAGSAERQIASLWEGLVPSAQASTGANTAPLAAGGIAGVLGWTVGIILGVVIYAVVWLASNMIDVLVLLCPFPAVDATLKAGRLAAIAALYGITRLSPTAGLVVSIPLIVLAALIAGFSLRLSVFGLVVSTDIVLHRRRHAVRAERGVLAFAGRGLKRRPPMRTLGRLRRTPDGRMVFSYRPWLIMPRRTTALPDTTAEYAACRGLLNPYVVRPIGNSYIVFVRLPPRYRGSEEGLLTGFGLSGVRETTLRRGFKAAFRAIRSLFSAREDADVPAV